MQITSVPYRLKLTGKELKICLSLTAMVVGGWAVPTLL